MAGKGSTNWRWYMYGAGVAACIAATLVFHFMGIRPLLERYSKSESYQAALSAQRGIAKDLAASADDMEENMGDAQKALDESPFHLRPANDVNNRIAQMAALANGCGLKLDEIQPGSPESGLRYETVPIHLAGTGNYRTCVALLHRMRQTFPDTTVIALELTGRPADPESPARFQLELLWHAAPASHARAGG